MWKTVVRLYGAAASAWSGYYLIERWLGLGQMSYWVVFAPISVPVVGAFLLFIVLGSSKHRR